MDIAQRLAQWAENDMRAESVALEAKDEIERLREALKKLSCNCASNCDLESDDICPSWIARAALKGDGPINEAQILATNRYESEGRN
jgi:hypothetical protein